jgi:nitroimidazol reductase NimA-like FMN-containing flavoprotein (pyridoxamine 5'-phosphate oxidase superfamily)
VVEPVLDVTKGNLDDAKKNLSTFDLVEREVRKKTFGVLSVVDFKDRPHTTGIIFAVSDPKDDFALYLVTLAKSAKVRYIKRNPNVSFLVTFPHYYLRFIPASTVMFRGKADIISLDDERAQAAFAQKRMTRMNLEVDSQILNDSVVIRIKPSKIVYVYGIGVGLTQMWKDPSSARYKVVIPPERNDEKLLLKDGL